MKDIVIKDLIKVGLVSKNQIGHITENKEDFVYPVQFTNYKYKLSKVNAKISKYNQIYSLGTGGEFNYADSQILFHKSIDLVNNLNNKESMKYQITKPHNYVELNSFVKLGKSIVGDKYPTYIIAEAGLNHNGSLEIGKKLILEAKKCGVMRLSFKASMQIVGYLEKVKSVNYTEEADGLQENIHDMFNRLSLNFKQTKKIV